MTNYRDAFGENSNSQTNDDNRRKNLFNIYGRKIVVNQTDETLLSEVESEKYVKNYIKQKTKFIPSIDYNKPETFAYFGSAQKYYQDAIEHIHESYPYDGSRAEKVDWSLSASLIDLYMLEHEYPKSTGHLELERSSVSSADTLYNTYTTPRYVSFSGGPQKNTIYNASKNRESNLKIDGTTGNTVEFWLKKDNASWQSALSREVILDVDTEHDDANVDRGRLTIELQVPSSSAASPFMITYTSGSTGTSTSGDERGLRIGDSTITTTSIADGKWHHYAVSMKSTENSTVYRLYVDGVLNHSVTESYSIGPVANFTNAVLGAANGGASTLGTGQMSGSIDEFRFWKIERTQKQIGDNWYHAVHGGSDNDNSNADLGVYFKFNEGITGLQTHDEIVLDYSGRINNGKITGWKQSLRSEVSGIESSENLPELDFKEVADPIINPENTLVTALVDKFREKGLSHDIQNAGALRNSVPQFFIDQDNGFFKELLQIMASSFDDLFLKVKNLPKMKQYNNQDFFGIKGSYSKRKSEQLLGCAEELKMDFVGSHTKPWTSQILEHYGLVTTEIFANASLVEQFLGRTKDITFEKDLNELKNAILSNIHKNLINIYKSKGTESSFRNLVRCFGVDQDLIKLKTYGNNEEYVLESKPIYATLKQRSVSFQGLNQAATIHQVSSSSGERDYITGSTNYIPFTMESNILFPQENEDTSSSLTSTSLFGMHNVNGSEAGNNLDWHTNDSGSFQVEFVRNSKHSKDGHFRLSGTDSVFTAITSSNFLDVYDNSQWNISVRVGAQGDLDFNVQETSPSTAYLIEFTGYNYDLDILANSFYVTASISGDDFRKISELNKAVYVGAHRTNFSGSVVKNSDVRVLSFNYWEDALEERELKEHAQNASNFGRANPEMVSLFDDGRNQLSAQSLALRWQFATLTASSGTGTMDIIDFSHGSDITGVSDITKIKHPGKGIGFENNDQNAIRVDFIPSVEYSEIDNVYTSDRVKIKDLELDVFEPDSRPITHFYSFEKSMYESISREMVDFFAGMKGFNNLIGEPVNKYRQNYKLLENMRQRFFSRVENTIDLEKFVDYYRWIDESLSHFLNQLVPASAHFGGSITDVVESHILERNKITHRAPTVEFKDPAEKVFPILGVRELLYDWEFGHGSPNYETLVNQKAILLDGVNDHVLISDQDDFSFTDGSSDRPFSISAWVLVGDVSADNGPFVSKVAFDSGANKTEYLFKHFNGELRMFMYDTSKSMSGDKLNANANAVSLTDNTWHHVVMTYDGSGNASGINLYTDGSVTAATKTESSTGGTGYDNMRNTTTPLIIGATQDGAANSTPARVFEDKIADVVIFNKELTSIEVSEVYNSGRVKDMTTFSAYSNIISWWKMGDDLDATGANNIKDYVGGFHGTLTNDASIISVPQTDLPSDTQFNAHDGKCLWHRERAEVTDDRADLKRIIHTEVSGSTYVTRKLTKPYRFGIDRIQAIASSYNSKANKITEAYKILNTGKTATIAAGTLREQDKCPDIIDPARKESYRGLLEVSDTNDYLDLDMDLLLPFNLMSASAGSEFAAFKDNMTISNNHLDIGITGEGSLQSPFTRQHIGGLPHRRYPLTTAAQLADSSAIAKLGKDRPEAYKITANSSEMVISANDADAAKSFIYRDLGVGSNINIRNIKNSDDGRILGNYDNLYEVVLQNGRTRPYGIRAVGSISFTTSTNIGATITITSTNGKLIIYRAVAHNDADASAATFSNGLSFGTTSSQRAAHAGRTLAAAINHENGHKGEIFATHDSGVVTILQLRGGLKGNTQIQTTNLSNATVVDFEGGSDATPAQVSMFVSSSRSSNPSPNQARDEHVIVNRFTGDHKANEQLEQALLELSARNPMNYRHIEVRNSLDDLYASSSANPFYSETGASAIQASNTQTLTGVNAASLTAGQTMNLIDAMGKTHGFVVSTTPSDTNGDLDGSGLTIIQCSDVGNVEGDNIDLAQQIVAAVNAASTAGRIRITASTPASDSAQLTLTQTDPGILGNVDVVSNIHGYGNFSFTGGKEETIGTSLYISPNENPRRFTGSVGQQSVSNNHFVTNPVPQSDYQYSWIAGSVDDTVYDFLNKNNGMGHVIGDGIAFAGSDADMVSLETTPRYSRISGQVRSANYLAVSVLRTDTNTFANNPFFFNKRQALQYSGGAGSSAFSAANFGPADVYFSSAFSISLDVSITTLLNSAVPTSESGSVRVSLVENLGNYKLFMIAVPPESVRDRVDNFTLAVEIGSGSNVIRAISTIGVRGSKVSSVVLNYDGTGGHSGISMFIDGKPVALLPCTSAFEETTSSPSGTAQVLGDPGLAHNNGTSPFELGVCDIQFNGQPTIGETLILEAPASAGSPEKLQKVYTAASSNDFANRQYAIGSTPGDTAQNLADAIAHASGHNGAITANWNSSSNQLELRLANIHFGSSLFIYGTLIRTSSGSIGSSLKTSSSNVFRTDSSAAQGWTGNHNAVFFWFKFLGATGTTTIAQAHLIGSTINLYSLALINRVLTSEEIEELQELKFKDIIPLVGESVYYDYKKLSYVNDIKAYWRFDELVESSSNVFSFSDEVNSYSLAEDSSLNPSLLYNILSDNILKASMTRQKYSIDSISVDAATNATDDQKLHALAIATGIHGHPSWKQIFHRDHPVVKHQRKNNEITIVTRTITDNDPFFIEAVMPDSLNDYKWDWYNSAEQNLVNDAANGNTLQHSRQVQKFKEMPVSSKFKPLTSYTLESATRTFVGNSQIFPFFPGFNKSDFQKDIWFNTEKSFKRVYKVASDSEINNLLKSTRTHQNDITMFSNRKLNKKLEIKDTDTISLGLDQTLLAIEDANQSSRFLILKYVEALYPREENAFREQTRERTLFDFEGWRNTREDRTIVLEGNVSYELGASTNSQNHLFPEMNLSEPLSSRGTNSMNLAGLMSINKIEISPASIEPIIQSRWLLDAREDFSVLPKNIATHGYFLDPLNYLEEKASFTNAEGEFQNDYSTFACGLNTLYGTPPAAILYNRRIPQTYVDGSDTNVYLAGEAEWQVPEQAGSKPYGNSYDEETLDLRKVLPDHSLVPEFRISDFIERAVNSNSVNNDMRTIKDMAGWLNLTGAVFHQSSAEIEVDGGFYKTYSTTDFMKYFVQVDEFLEQEQSQLTPSAFTLRCRAGIKFTPYKGFYPAERVSQIGEIFSRGYMSQKNIPDTISASDWASALKRANLQQAIKPLMSPGVLMNSIKSGVAVDYPIFGSSADDTALDNFTTAIEAQESFYESFDNSLQDLTNMTGSEVNSTTDTGIPRLKGPVSKRVTFEDLLDPERLLGEKIYDNEPHPSGSIYYGNKGLSIALDYPFLFGRADQRRNQTRRIPDAIGLRYSSNFDAYKLAIQNFCAETVNFFLKDSKLATLEGEPISTSIQLEPTSSYKMRIYVRNRDQQMYDRHSAFGPPVDEGDLNKKVRTWSQVNSLEGTRREVAFSPCKLIFDSVNITASSEADLPAIKFKENDGTIYSIKFFNSETTPAIAEITAAQEFDNGSFKINSSIKTAYINLSPVVMSFSGTVNEFTVRSRRNRAQLTAFSGQLQFALTKATMQLNRILGPTFDGVQGVSIIDGRDNIENFSVNVFQQLPDEVTSLIRTNFVIRDEVPGSFPSTLDITYVSSSFVQGLFEDTLPTAFTDGTAPGLVDQFAETTSGVTDSHEFAPFYPPFLDSGAEPYINVTFTTSANPENVSAQDVLTKATFEFVNFKETPSNASGGNNFNHTHAMNLAASLDLRNFSAYTQAFSDATDSSLEERSRLVIQTKWETPVLNFDGVSSSVYNLDTDSVEEITTSKWHTRTWDDYLIEQPKAPSESEYLQSSRGMWHQFGSLNRQANKGYFLSVEESPDVTSDKQLSRILGFTNESVKSKSVPIGEVANQKVISEAVVAVPFWESTDGSNTINWFTYSDQVVQNANNFNAERLQILNTKLEDNATLGNNTSTTRKNIVAQYERFFNSPSDIFMSIDETIQANTAGNDRDILPEHEKLMMPAYQLRMMQKYIFPPSFDFLHNGPAFVGENQGFVTNNRLMYVFQFNATLTDEDLANIWQNVMPTSSTSGGKPRYSNSVGQDQAIVPDVEYLSHFLNSDSFMISEEQRDSYRKENVRWMLFKVKMRAKTDLGKVKEQSLPGVNQEKKILSQSSFQEQVDPKLFPYSYNWPYDYFSIVELIKLESKAEFVNFIAARDGGGIISS